LGLADAVASAGTHQETTRELVPVAFVAAAAAAAAAVVAAVLLLLLRASYELDDQWRRPPPVTSLAISWCRDSKWAKSDAARAQV